jgi:hypothetical protein
MGGELGPTRGRHRGQRRAGGRGAATRRGRDWKAGGARERARATRARGAAESLAQVVLGFESIIVFLGGLAVYGLNALPAGIPPGGGSSAAPCWRRS